MDIGKYLGISVLSVALLLASSIPSLAKNSRAIALPHDAVLSGTTLPAGHYVVQWVEHSPDATVQFMRGRKVVLSAEGRFEDRGKKYGSSSVVYRSTPEGPMSISEIRFAGSSQVLVFK